ncbi:MAG: hypothetical protein BWX84_00147 [Verrucomicrobia bacterium ADurb.Bin118]|jgi:uncharacterized protein (DUF983 family)|nr:MAG: hypothetical protein BWX84_00147 [Verrucomicrobia bacterium ADurb.Bin118]
MDPEAQLYLRTMRIVLNHPVRCGTCPQCGREAMRLFRLATKDVCRQCVQRAFKSKLRESN